jgi:hypothetical protein
MPNGDYRVKQLGSLTLQETVVHLGVESYGLSLCTGSDRTGGRHLLQKASGTGGSRNWSTNDLPPIRPPIVIPADCGTDLFGKICREIDRQSCKNSEQWPKEDNFPII